VPEGRKTLAQRRESWGHGRAAPSLTFLSPVRGVRAECDPLLEVSRRLNIPTAGESTSRDRPRVSYST